MRILMLKDYFYPEQCAGISLAQDLVKEFSENNHFVEVFRKQAERSFYYQAYTQQFKNFLENITGW